MIISFVRHGESLSNVKGIFSSDIKHSNGLTETGRGQIEDVAKEISGRVVDVYSSPFIRAVESAEIFIENRSEKLKLTIDDRLGEIDYGEQSSKKDSPEMVEVSRRQIAGDYEIRFGKTGENKREIITRFFDFLISLADKYKETDHVVIFSHGRAISIIEGEINKLKGIDYTHSSTNNAESRQIDFNMKRDIPLLRKAINELELDRRVLLVKKRYRLFDDTNIDIQRLNKDCLLDIAKKGLNDDELSTMMLDMFTYGMYVSQLKPISLSIDKNSLSIRDVILICSLKDADLLIGSFIEHHKKIGISNFVFIDNNSSDDSANIIKHYNSNDIKIDLWYTKDVFDGFKAMGWKQRLMAYYGTPNWFLNLDIDEFFVYLDMEKHTIERLVDKLEKEKSTAARAIMLDIYPNRSLLVTHSVQNKASVFSEYKYIDRSTYGQTVNDKFGYRFFGGPRARAFGLRSSLQKHPLAYIQPGTLGINPHFWYPYKVNLNTKCVAALLHYKFLPGDFEKYQKYAKTGIHWNNSKEYRSYVNVINENPDLNLYDKRYSIEYTSSRTLKNIIIKDIADEKPLNLF